MRTTNSSVTFRHTFTLSGVDNVCAPGTYAVETDKESIAALSFLAYRHVSTRITLGPTANAPGRTTTHVIDRHELAAALARDEEEGINSVTGVREFIKAGGGLTDTELVSMMRAMMVAAPLTERRDWLRQVELSLDGYGGEIQRAAAGRVKGVLRQLEAETA